MTLQEFERFLAAFEKHWESGGEASKEDINTLLILAKDGMLVRGRKLNRILDKIIPDDEIEELDKDSMVSVFDAVKRLIGELNWITAQESMRLAAEERFFGTSQT